MHPDCDDKDEIMKASPHREWSMITTSCCISKAGGFVQHNLIMTWFDIKFRRKKRIHDRRSQNFIFGQERADNLFQVGAIAAFCANRSILLHLILLKKEIIATKKHCNTFINASVARISFFFRLSQGDMAIGAIAKENETILFQNNTQIVLLLKISVSSFGWWCVEGLTPGKRVI